MTLTFRARLVLASSAVLALAACDSTGSYRLGSVGSAGTQTADNGNSGGSSSSSSGGTSSSSGGSTGMGGGSSGGASTSSGGSTQGGLGSNLLVTSGNAVIGVAGKQASLTSGLTTGLPGGSTVSGTVAGLLTKTGQTLVKLGNGNTLILNGTGGQLGDVLGLNLGSGKVVSAPAGSSSLVGLNLLARNPTTGRLATVNTGSSGNLVSVTVPGTNLLSGTNTPLSGVLGNTGVGTTVNGVVNAGSNTVGVGAKGSANGSGTSLSGSVNAVTKPVTGVLGINGTITPK